MRIEMKLAKYHPNKVVFNETSTKYNLGTNLAIISKFSDLFSGFVHLKQKLAKNITKTDKK